MRRDVAVAAGFLAHVRCAGMAFGEGLVQRLHATTGGLLVIRKAILVTAGVGLAQLLLERMWYPELAQSKSFYLLTRTDPWASSYLLAFYRWGLRGGLPLVLLGLLNFLEIQAGWTFPQHGGQVQLPPYPEDPKTTQLVLGEVHHQDGSRSDRPEWLVLPEAGMFTGLLCVGATGRGKTSRFRIPREAS